MPQPDDTEEHKQRRKETYKVLKEDHDDHALLHFVFGRNREAVGAAAPSHSERTDDVVASGDGAEKPKAMQVLPDDVFALVCRFLVN